MHGLTQLEIVVLLFVASCAFVTMIFAYYASSCYRRLLAYCDQDNSSTRRKVFMDRSMFIYSRVLKHATTFPGTKVCGENNLSDIVDEETLIINKSESNSIDSYSSMDEMQLELNDNGVPECVICWSQYQVGEEVCWSKYACNHVFHSKCLEIWIKRKSQCPICRRDFLCKGMNTAKSMQNHVPNFEEFHFCQSHGIVANTYCEEP